MSSARPWLYLIAGALVALLILLASWHLCFGAQSVTLAWNPVTNVGVAGYNIYLGSKSSNYTAVTNVGNVTNATVSVTNNPAYFAATTIGSNGMESAYSTQVVVDTNIYETNISFTYTNINLSWAVVVQKSHNLKSWAMFKTTVTNTLSDTLTGTNTFYRAMVTDLLCSLGQPSATNVVILTNPPPSGTNQDFIKPPMPANLI